MSRSANKTLPLETIQLVDQLDHLLPQTQCGKCGHGGCRPYAEAMAQGESHTKCPPGGERTLEALATALHRPLGQLEEPAETPKLAVIREDECIGCTKCIQACPVDAIVGAAKLMHGVLENECTGCELCVAPCPVDCIDIVDHPVWKGAHNTSQQQAYLDARAAMGRQRFAAHNARMTARKAALQANRMERLKRRVSSRSETVTHHDKSEHGIEGTRTRFPAETSASVTTAPSSRASGRDTIGAKASAVHGASSKGHTPRDAAMIARLIHKLSRMSEDDPKRAEIEQRLQSLHAEADAAAPQQSRQLKMALAAAEQRRRMAERHLKHCIRQCGPAEIEAAKEQLAQAQLTEQQAREALG
ncbi:Ion-translocating oxidoreductase complex subunit B [Halomonadaceae bacterium LMG 33818]